MHRIIPCYFFWLIYNLYFLNSVIAETKIASLDGNSTKEGTQLVKTCCPVDEVFDISTSRCVNLSIIGFSNQSKIEALNNKGVL